MSVVGQDMATGRINGNKVKKKREETSYMVQIMLKSLPWSENKIYLPTLPISITFLLLLVQTPQC